jgi:hypothetical protein
MVGRATSEMRRKEFVTSGPQYPCGHIYHLHVRSNTTKMEAVLSRKIQWKGLRELYKDIIMKIFHANWRDGCLSKTPINGQQVVAAYCNPFTHLL